ncbi:MAG: hypothetical protein AABY06_02140 [Nanoarchaeota archaeon]
MLQPSLQDCEAIFSYIESSNQFYQDLLGYKPEKTRLQSLDYQHWRDFCKRKNLNENLQTSTNLILKGEGVSRYFILE